MKIGQIALGVFLLGLCCLLGAVLWPLCVQPKMVWSEAQALEHSQASAEMHRLSHEKACPGACSEGGGNARGSGAALAAQDLPHGAEAYAAAAKRLKETTAALERARSFREGPAASSNGRGFSAPCWAPLVTTYSGLATNPESVWRPRSGLLPG
jgi:hypothetical protein